MFSYQTIRNISDVAAYRAAEEGKVPLPIWSREDAPHIPFLGTYVPAGYRRATFADLPELAAREWHRHPDDEVTLLVDSTGLDDYGPAHSLVSFGYLAAADGQYWAIIEAGQFQVVVAAYVKDDDAPAQNLPDEDDVRCTECSEVHSDLEECWLDDYYDSEQDEDGEYPLFAN